MSPLSFSNKKNPCSFSAELRYAQPIRLSLEEYWVQVSVLDAVVYTKLAMLWAQLIINANDD